MSICVVSSTYPLLLYVSKSITHSWGRLPPGRDDIDKAPERSEKKLNKVRLDTEAEDKVCMGNVSQN